MWLITLETRWPNRLQRYPRQVTLYNGLAPERLLSVTKFRLCNLGSATAFLGSANPRPLIFKGGQIGRRRASVIDLSYIRQ